MLTETQKSFLDLLLQSEALKFGNFVLKSGRQSPYFINIGMLASGEVLLGIGEAYADIIKENIKADFDVVFGPAYKGIPLAVATCQALWQKYGIKTSYVSDRKEEKDHGDRGKTFGAELTADAKIVFVDDVISAGTSLRNSLKLLQNDCQCNIIGAIISVDRQERGTKTLSSALPELENEFNLNVYSILKIRDVVEELHGKTINGKTYISDRLYNDFLAYQRRYGSE